MYNIGHYKYSTNLQTDIFLHGNTVTARPNSSSFVSRVEVIDNSCLLPAEPDLYTCAAPDPCLPRKQPKLVPRLTRSYKPVMYLKTVNLLTIRCTKNH